MPLEAFQITIFALGVIALATGTWLLVHARDVARVFRREPDIELGPGPRRASRGTTIFVLIVFNLAWIASLVLWALLI